MDINSADLRSQGKDLRKIAETFKKKQAEKQAEQKQKRDGIQLQSPQSPAQTTRPLNMPPPKFEQRSQPPRLPGMSKS